MKHHWYLKHWMCSLPDVKVAADIDEVAPVVTLEIEALDTTQLLKVVSQVLPEHGVVAYADDTEGWVPARPDWSLRIRWESRLHRARVSKLPDGTFALRVEAAGDDPSDQ